MSINYGELESIKIMLENNTLYGRESGTYSIRLNRIERMEDVISDITDKLKRLVKMDYLHSLCLTVELENKSDWKNIPVKRYTYTYNYNSAERLPMIEHRPYNSERNEYPINDTTEHKTNNNLIKTITVELMSIYKDCSDKKALIDEYLQSIA